MSLLVRPVILRLFVNPLTADSNYSQHIAGRLLQPIQMHLSEERKSFPGYFVPFLEPTLDFEYFGKNI